MPTNMTSEEKLFYALWKWHNAVNKWYKLEPKWYEIKKHIAWRRAKPQPADFYN